MQAGVEMFKAEGGDEERAELYNAPVTTGYVDSAGI